MLSAAEIAYRLGAEQKGMQRWQARCPAHPDRVQSLSITAADGRVLLYCHAGCKFNDIIYWVNNFKGFESVEQKQEEPKVVAEYDYLDSDGTLLYQVLRLQPKSFRQRMPDGNGGWINTIKGVKRVPYHLTEWQDEPSKKLIIFVEGEKDADNAAKLGFKSTAIAGGASAWRPEMADYFVGRSVVLIPDNDEPGRTFVNTVAADLEHVARMVKIVELPGLQPKQDLSDWIEAGGTKEQLLELVKASPALVYRTDEQLAVEVYGEAQQQPEPETVGEPLSKILERRANQLATGESGISYVPTGIDRFDRFYGGLECGIVTIIGARPGVGKSTSLIVVAIASAKAGKKVLWISLEDPPARTAERVLAHEHGRIYDPTSGNVIIDPDRFEGYQAPEWADNISFVRENGHINPISDWIRTGNYDLVLIDYAQLMKSDTKDEMTHGKVVMEELTAACQSVNCAVLLAVQVKRGGGETLINGDLFPPTMSELRGSGYWEQIAKCIILVHRDTKQISVGKTQPKLRADQIQWIIEKSNFGGGAGYLTLTFDPATSSIIDEGE